MKPLSKLLTSILSAVKTGPQSYWDTSYSMGSVNQMWILIFLNDMLKYIQSRFLTSCNYITTFVSRSNFAKHNAMLGTIPDHKDSNYCWGLHGRDHKVVGFTTTCAINAHHH